MNSDNTTAPAAELPDELRQLQAEAIALEPTTPEAPGESAPAALAVDHVAEAKAVIDMGAELLGMVGPKTESALTEDRRQKIANAAGPLMAKYGLTLGVLFERWGAEINFLFALVVVGKPIAAAVISDLDDQKVDEKRENAAQRPAPAPVEKSELMSRAFPG